MSKDLIPFGICCRQHRLRLGLIMAEQANALGCSVSAISAIERGSRPIPAGYPSEFASWLNLGDIEANELKALAAGERTAIQISPADPERAQLAFDFAKTLNNLPIEEVRHLRKRLALVGSRRHSVEDLRRWALLLRSCFELGNKLAFDLMEIIENRMILIDPEFSLEVKPDHALGARAAAHARAVGDLISHITMSESMYDGASRQIPEPYFAAAHELAHWFLNTEGTFTTAGQRVVFQYTEVDADRFAREFLLPKDVAS
jgi:hypothetical protein